MTEASRAVADAFKKVDAAGGSATVKVGAGHVVGARLRARKVAMDAVWTKLEARRACDVVADDRTSPQEFLASLRDAIDAAAEKPFAQAMADIAATCIAATEAAILHEEV